MVVDTEMDAKPSPHLKKVLKSYQLNAANTMSGPGVVLNGVGNGTGNGVGGGSAGGGSGHTGASLISQLALRGGVGGGASAAAAASLLALSTPKFNMLASDKRDSNANNSSSKMAIKRVLITQDPTPTELVKNPVLYKSLGSQYTISQSLMNEQDMIKIRKENLDGVLNLKPHPVNSNSPSPPPPISINSSAGEPSKSFLPPPILSKADQSRSEKRETVLEGELISYFAVGGEKRLCFPQILTSVLRGFNLQQINQVCDELQIFCSQCSPEQLEVLKHQKIIPPSAPSCGLIKKTDAERLVNSLLHRNPPKAAVSFLAATALTSRRSSSTVSTDDSVGSSRINGDGAAGTGRSNPMSHFRIYHECFGKCKGVILPHLYDRTDALCIECLECSGLFSPPRFVSHSHRRENRTCHWGFDSANWRRYIMVSKDENEDLTELLQKALEELKTRFELKRKDFSPSPSDGLPPEDLQHVVIKKVCYSPPAATPAPRSISLSPESFSNLPTKKRLPFIQYSTMEMDSADLARYELESIKKLVLQNLGADGAALVNGLIDKQSKEISNLEQICKTQQELLHKITDPKSGIELQAKVNTMEAELHSLKKQILRRHESHEHGADN